ncbi:MAG: hypothetical protein AAGG11_22125, partial [Pseudomonadota bacterium]
GVWGGGPPRGGAPGPRRGPHADRIVVLNGGRVQAEGTHEELLEADSLYAEFSRLQFADRDYPGTAAGR